jgi:sugar lactone lactonase YvrE
MSWKQVYNSRTYRALLPIAIIVGFIAISCQKQKEAPPAEPSAADQSAAKETPKEEIAAPTLAPAEPKEETAAVEPNPIIIKDAGFQTPESVLFDATSDVYLVSNINGSPTAEDNNGFISKVGPDGTVVDLKWIEGGQKEVALNAPKGMAVRGDVLYVADISTVRMFDRATGAPEGNIAVKGAGFLNDLSSSPDGTIYLSDSGVKVGEKGFVPTGTDAVYKIDAENKVTKLIGGKALRQPNGLLAEEGGVWVVTMGGNELYRVSNDGKKEPSVTVPSGGLDGLVRTNDGRLLISSWEASTVFSGPATGQFSAAWAGIQSPADIGYDTKRNRLLVPSFEGNTVQIQPVPAPATAASALPATAPPTVQKGLRSDAPEPEVAADNADDGKPVEPEPAVDKAAPSDTPKK